jgi:hypothetical protein
VSAPRVLGYDDLYQYLEEAREDAEGLASEYADQGDDEERFEQIGRAAAFDQVLSHIRFELEASR